MPAKPAVMCNKPGCVGLVRDNVCSVCGPRKRPNYMRESSTRRGYNKRWQRFRKRAIRNRILAGRTRCDDCGEPFTVRRDRREKSLDIELHHKIALRKGGAKLDVGNISFICKSCHSKRTGRGE
jgi:5-methylcytosine-specific restriction endonuclease McrA